MEDPDLPEVVPESYEQGQQYVSDSLDSPNKERQYLDVASERWPEYCNPHYKMPDMIEVKVTIGAENFLFPVHVSKAQGSKPYLGGYRHKINGAVYHHASSQTPTEQKKTTKEYGNQRTRETQTVQYRTLSIQSTRESGTQMERVDLKLYNQHDKVVNARVYFTSEELLIKKKAATILIQRYWRGFMARNRARLIRQRNVDYNRAIADERAQKANDEEESRLRDLARRAHPRTNNDFEVLYNELDQWRQSEMQKIKSSIVDPAERKTAMQELLLNETKALQHLQRLRFTAQQEMHSEKTQLMLSNMSAPLRWQLHNGGVAFVHTPETQRARRLLDLYSRLLSETGDVDDRLDILLKVKWEVAEDSSEAAGELRQLLDREADLLQRRRPWKSMANLRMRISHLFLQLVQSPDFNPRATDFIKEKM